MDLLKMMELGVERKASDIHITAGVPVVFRINGELIKIGAEELTSEMTEELSRLLLNDRQFEELKQTGEIDLSYSTSGVGRFRINIYRQRGSYGIAIRIIPLEIPTAEQLGLPHIVRELTKLPRGLVLVTGPTGSGKSTTLAYMINQINMKRKCHIITLEDPIEYLHTHNVAMINQREIGNDSHSFSNALRAALRQDPDVILVGEMRDLETIGIALTAAETGHLVLSTLHTSGAAKTIDRVIDIFPPHQQQQVRIQLSSVIKAIISQQLIPTIDYSRRVAAFEVMISTDAISNLIREEKVHQVNTVIQTGSKLGMQTMDSSLLELYKRGLISKDLLLVQAANPDLMKKYLL